MFRGTTSRLGPFRLLAIACAAGVMFCHSPSPAQSWKTGAGFRRQLEMPAGIRWKSNPLRDALRRLSQAQEAGVFLDRRVNPDQRVDFAVADVPLDELFKRLAAHLRIGCCKVGPVVYFGPTSTTSRLATLAAIKREEAGRLSAPADPSAFKTSFRWDMLAEPRDLVARTAEQAGVKVFHLDRIPHDLWAAGELPPLGVADRLTVLLAGFNLTFDVAPDGSAIRVAPMPAPQPYVREYALQGDARGARAQSVASQIAGQFPEAEVRAEAGKIHVAASFEDHEAIARLLRGEPARRRKVVQGESRYSLKMDDAPIGPLIRGLGERLNLQVEFDPSLADKLDQLVSFNVLNATLDELLKEILAPVDLQHELDDQTLRIVPAAMDN